MRPRRWSFVEPPSPPPRRSSWRFTLGYLATLAVGLVTAIFLKR